MMRNLFFLLLPFVFFGCSEQENSGGFHVKGRIKNLSNASISISELTPKGLILIDTAMVDQYGNFELNGHVSEKTFCAINLQQGSVVLVVDSASSIYLSLDASKPDIYGVTGSAESEELRKLLQLNNQYLFKVQQLEKRYGGYNEDLPPVSVQDQIRAEYDSIMKQRKQAIVEFSSASKEGIVAYFAAGYLMPESDFEFLEQIDEQFFPLMNQSKYAREHHQRVELLRRTAIGQPAPDIILPDPFGKTIALSALRGKYVLVDFWASWCRPCRQESPNLVNLYNKFKSFGFDILSVSLDDNHEAWIKAINDDHLLWNHVSDLKKWNSEVVSRYNIEGIPFTLLLNKDGVIIGKNLRGDALAKRLEEAIKLGL